MTSEMNTLLEKLQEAIDEAIAQSARIDAIVAEVKSCGFDLCLVLESSVAISPIEDNPADAVPEPRLSLGDMKLTADDVEFLQELNISATE